MSNERKAVPKTLAEYFIVKRRNPEDDNAINNTGGAIPSTYKNSIPNDFEDIQNQKNKLVLGEERNHSSECDRMLQKLSNIFARKDFKLMGRF